MRSPFGADVDDAIKQHAIDEYPNECCGVIVDGKYIRAMNVALNPQATFEIDKETLQTFANRIEGIAHSHPKPSIDSLMPYPSKIDMEQQVLWDIPWAIVSVIPDAYQQPFCVDMFWFGDSLPRLPLLNRVFRPGIQDCYALARDYYLDKGFDLPEIPRDEAWWTDDVTTGRKRANLFIDMLDASGFEIIAAKDVQPGDGFAVPYGTSVICHCGVLLDFDKVLHHLSGQRSTVTAAYRWTQRAVDAGKFFRVRK